MRQRHPGAEILAGGQDDLAGGGAEPSGAEYQVGGAIVCHCHDLNALDPDGNAVPIAAVSRTANYLDASYQILKDVKLTKTKSVNLNFSFRHEYVEPLFKSLGASASADKTAQDYALD